ncbi:hypothetical protein [Streptomyces sp. NPDC059272]|uniref:hypothetical protein n=1 Tax=Streptomyces sp. NPDC059272 TaxID=3346800 RepID=UPI0036845A43
MTHPSPHTPAASPAPSPGVDWHHEAGVLHVRCAWSTGHPDEYDDLLTTIEVNTDVRDWVTDVVIKDLPPSAAGRLSGYALAPVDEFSPTAGISLDPDAGWLWLHLREDRHGQRQNRRAHVRFSYSHEELTAVDVDLPVHPTPDAGEVPGTAKEPTR